MSSDDPSVIGSIVTHGGRFITRDRLQEFVSFRKAARRQEEWLRRTSSAGDGADGDHDTNVALDVEDGSGGGGGGVASASKGTASPPWVRALQSFNDLEGTVSTRIERLQEQQHEFLSPKFISTEEEEDTQHELEVLANDIQKLLKELERMILQGVRPADANNGDEVHAARNVQKHLSTRLTALMTQFRDGQQFFADQLTKRNEKAKRFNRIGSAEVHEKIQREEDTAKYLQLGYSEAEISELLTEEARQREVADEVQQILESIKELHEMFKDLGAMVVEQGTVLDRIDHNIMKTMDNVGSGIVQLKKAREHQSRCSMQ